MVRLHCSMHQIIFFFFETHQIKILIMTFHLKCRWSNLWSLEFCLFFFLLLWNYCERNIYLVLLVWLGCYMKSRKILFSVELATINGHPNHSLWECLLSNNETTCDLSIKEPRSLCLGCREIQGNFIFYK